jgi:hypothetical protein
LRVPHLLDAIEEALYLIALTVNPSTEAECLFAIGLCRDIRPAPALFGKVTNCIGVICLVRKDRCSGLNVAQQLSAMGAPQPDLRLIPGEPASHPHRQARGF